MKLLHSLLNDHKLLSIGVCLLSSAMISGAAFAEETQNGFPPLSEDKKSDTTINKVVPAPNASTTRYPQRTAPTQNRYYYPQMQRSYYPQQMQGYRPAPYGYYPQQQMLNYPTRQAAYPRYQPYAQSQTQATPYRPYPVTPYSNQRPYNYPQVPTQQMNKGAHSTGKNLYPMRKKIKKEKHAWGDERHIWPDFYTDFTGNAWDKMINAPFDAGRMPGGWRAPSLSSPDPVTVGDAVANQIPPIAEEMGNMTNFAN